MQYRNDLKLIYDILNCVILNLRESTRYELSYGKLLINDSIKLLSNLDILVANNGMISKSDSENILRIINLIIFNLSNSILEKVENIDSEIDICINSIEEIKNLIIKIENQGGK